MKVWKIIFANVPNSDKVTVATLNKQFLLPGIIVPGSSRQKTWQTVSRTGKVNPISQKIKQAKAESKKTPTTQIPNKYKERVTREKGNKV